MKINTRKALATLVSVGAMVSILGCEAQQQLGSIQQRRVEVPQASGADESLDDRFGLTADAQDPSERDAEMGYGRWKGKPEPTGTAAKTSSTRRGKSWGGSP